MKNRSCFLFQSPALAVRVESRNGQTLVEVMIAFAVFTILATCIASTLLQTRRMVESDIAQAEAQTIAQGIIEQVQLVPFDTLAIDPASSPDVVLKFVGVTSSNLVQIQDFNLKWATDATYKAIGEVQGGLPPKGVLLDVDYKNTSSSLVRNRRYMAMEVNLTKTVDNIAGDVSIVLNYKYPLPDRKSSGGAPVYLYQQIRTVRSQTASY